MSPRWACSKKDLFEDRRSNRVAARFQMYRSSMPHIHVELRGWLLKVVQSPLGREDFLDPMQSCPTPGWTEVHDSPAATSFDAHLDLEPVDSVVLQAKSVCPSAFFAACICIEPTVC